MRDTEYTFAVARIRCHEAKLLTAQELSSVISAPNFEDACRRLNDKGYGIEGADYSAALDRKLDDLWELINSVLPDKSQFDSIIIKNDFHNLKVMLKALVTEKEADSLFVEPTVYNTSEIKKYVYTRENSKLPETLAHADESAYSILTKTRFAQLSDSVIDRAALEWSIKLAEKADNPIMKEFAEMQAALSDIKILYRCILAKKARGFMERCVCECSAFSKKDIIKAAVNGIDAFFEFLSHTSFAGAVDALKEGTTVFEKWCDEKTVELLSKVKNNTFGIGAIVAYWYAVRTEILNIRIILCAKLNGLSEEEISRRVRAVYV